MALIQGGDITPESLIERFQTAVVTNILSGAYHAGNPPMCRGYQCVPINIMDHINNVNRTPNIGGKGQIVNAKTILDGLIAVTRNLTRVGTFAFQIYMRHTDSGSNPDGSYRPESYSNQKIDEISGKVIFTTQYIRSNFSNPTDIVGTEYGQPITASNLNQLLANIYSHWADSNRYKYTGTVEICHVVCHNNCHYNCHFNCHSTCHGWTIIKDNKI